MDKDFGPIVVLEPVTKIVTTQMLSTIDKSARTQTNPMREKRTRLKGRRDYEQPPECFIWRSDNTSVVNDRRRVPDRRVESIEVDWIDEELQILSLELP